MPALPVLGAAAKFLMANGTRAATMKFGKAAVDKAKDQIKKRDSAITDKAGKANIGVKRTQKPESTRRMQDTKRDKRVAKQERISDRSDALRPPKDEMPLKFRGGGMKSKMSTKGGMAGGKKKPPGMMGGGMMKSKMSTKGGMRGGKKIPPGMKKGGKFPDLTGDGKVTQKDILKGRGVPGFKEGGKKMPKGYAKGGMKSKTATKKKATKQKVRGAGIARKGVRPAKMR